jgi:hypothetical protein
MKRRLGWQQGKSGLPRAVPQRFPVGTILDYRDFRSAVEAHGRPYGPFDDGRIIPYDTDLPPYPKRGSTRDPDDLPF